MNKLGKYLPLEPRMGQLPVLEKAVSDFFWKPSLFTLWYNNVSLKDKDQAGPLIIIKNSDSLTHSSSPIILPKAYTGFHFLCCPVGTGAQETGANGGLSPIPFCLQPMRFVPSASIHYCSCLTCWLDYKIRSQTHHSSHRTT